MSDSASVYLEDRYQHGDASGLARAMGMNFSPSDRWTLGANWGFGTLVDHQTHAETERNAGGARLSYGFDQLHLSSGVEYRDDETEQPDLTRNDRTTWLFRNNFRFQVTPSGRILGKYNHSFSDSSLGDFFDGGYREGVLGYAYRPVDVRPAAHAREVHLLLQRADHRSADAPERAGAVHPAEPRRWRWTPRSTSTSSSRSAASTPTGSSQVSLDRDDPDFFDNNAHLYIVRGDYRFLKNWEGTVEGRMLDLTDLDERKIGSLFTSTATSAITSRWASATTSPTSRTT